jgi:succinate-semialdehyde dehydrogenase
MQAVDVVVATGGMGMVKAAYSSGKPAFGVGAGNVQVIVDRDVDFNATAAKMIEGRSFDNGIICSGEQTIIAHEDDYNEVIAAFEANGAFFVRDAEMHNKLKTTIFDGAHLNKDVVGQSVQKIASLAGVQIPEGTKVILLEASGIGSADILCKEKMCPVMSTFKYKTFEEAVQIAKTNLELEGNGHSAAIHSNNLEHIKYAGTTLSVSRLVVNAPSATTAGGSLFNGFAPTTTLGCGSWGNNSISENFTYKHLINISRIGMVRDNVAAPTDEQIWAN